MKPSNNDNSAVESDNANLKIAQDFIDAIESKDIENVAQTLAPNGRQLFMHSSHTTTTEGVADIIAGRRKGICVADVKGKKEILAYSEALMNKFTPLIWRNHQWHVTQNGNEIFFYGKGDMFVAKNGKPYRNSYVTRFDIENNKIIRMAEYADAFLYAGLGIRPNGTEFRSLLRAIGRLFSPRLSATSGK